MQSHPVWGAWIETCGTANKSHKGLMSHPVWGAWIETANTCINIRCSRVAPRVGCVD